MTARTLRDDESAVAIEVPVDGGFLLHVVTPDRTIRVQRRERWDAADVDRLLDRVGNLRKPELVPGETRTTRRYHLTGPWWLYTHVNTGPPTWWLPRVEVKRNSLMAGWIRGLVAVSVARESSHKSV